MSREKKMLALLKKSVFWGQRLFAVLGVCALAVIITAVTVGIVSRYVFGSPFSWTEELATFLFIWLSFLGAGVAAARRKHVLVDYISCRLGTKPLVAVRIVTYSLILLFLALLAAGAVLLQPQTTGHASVALNIPKNYYYLPVLVVSVYLFLVYLDELIEVVRNPNSCKG